MVTGLCNSRPYGGDQQHRGEKRYDRHATDVGQAAHDASTVRITRFAHRMVRSTKPL
jgi:hypothetical protein